ncbi:unnamed protein product, partial [marine sediment metagenome]
MKKYYQDKLSAERLKQCYDIAPSRVQRYLKAEIDYIQQKFSPGDLILDLGCGYGRELQQICNSDVIIIGIDTSYISLILGKEMLQNIANCFLMEMNAVELAFQDQFFDIVLCIQNGISAFHVDKRELIKESIRVTRPGGIILFSSYSDKFWKDRLEWFQLQSENGLLGEIDYEKSRNGTIICKDGFKATTIRPHQF